MEYITITADNLANEHLCCAIADKKHQCGVDTKRQWLAERIKEGHIFHKLNERGKVFIEYAPLEKAWVSACGKNYMFIYCHWVSGSFKGKGIGKELLDYCINDSKKKGKSGICVIVGKTKKPFLTDKAFMTKFGFKVVDTIDDYELLALSFDGTNPHFTENAHKQSIASKDLTIYYGLQCPYIPNCIAEIETFCKANKIPLSLVKIDTLEKAKSCPCVFNNWAVFHNGKYLTNHLLNESYLKKFLNI
ncbi:MAG: GNAT family N-acetyltransferase [Christensenellaceae bacterium]|jgi:ribosomal protein S18 acetylase RimI-like enzyme|nr:GNAT family N-acetyltransferase [Christensenellaceae bacterium]